MASRPHPHPSAPEPAPAPASVPEVDLHDVVRDALQTTGPLVRGRGLSVRARLCPEPLAVRARADEVVRAVTELVADAVCATTANGRFTLSLARSGGDAVLAVEHSRASIPAPGRPRVAGRSGVPSPCPRREAGDLAAARAWVAAQQGAVTASERGWSAGFEVRLPLAEGAGTPGPPGP